MHSKQWSQPLKRMAMIAVMLESSLLAADPVPVDNVVAAVRGWLAISDQKPLEEDLGNGLTFLVPGTDERGEILYYAAYLDNGGFVVMSPDDAIEPVIAFSSEAGDLSDPSPCNHLRMMLEADLTDRPDREAVCTGVVTGWGLDVVKASTLQQLKAVSGFTLLFDLLLGAILV